MPFTTLEAKARRYTLGHPFFNWFLENGDSNDLLAAVEHTPDGLHNAQTVARAVGGCTYSAGYTIDTGSSSFISSVATPAVGTATLTLTTGKFTTPMSVLVTPTFNSGDQPWIATSEVVSATSIKVYLFKLDSTAGNAWTATDGNFVISIFCDQYASTATPVARATARVRGQSLDVATWNNVVEDQAVQRANLLVGHTSAGAHNIREIARGYGRFTYAASAYTLAAGVNVTSGTRLGAGICRVNLPASTYTTLMQPFVQVGYDTTAGATGDVYLAHCPQSSMTATTCTVRLWKYTASTDLWALADADFSVTIHTAAA